MSYDLYFYKRKSSPLSEQQVADYLNEYLIYNQSESDRQWDYENPDTGVYFMVDWNEPDQEDTGFEDFASMNFSCSINFFRPDYFAFEVFPIITQMVEALDLLLLNPQDTDYPDTPRKFDGQYLQQQWTRINHGVTIDQFEKLQFNYLPAEKSNAIWWYQSYRQEIENDIQEDISIPNYIIVKRAFDQQLYTACVWPLHIPVLLPPVDYVIIKRRQRKLFKTVEENGFVPRTAIEATLGSFFEDLEHAVPNLRILRQHNADRMEKLFNALPIEAPMETFGSIVGFDGFVNVKP